MFEEFDVDEQISYQQWQTTGRSNIVTISTSLDEYIENLVAKLEKLTSHSYLSKTQAEYLHDRNENMTENYVTISGDFAENYKFVVQDEVQGFHWNTSQITLHPVVILQRKQLIKKQVISSNDMDHVCIV